MINKKMFKSAAVITAVMLSVSGCAGGCSEQTEPVIADATVETPEPEESIETKEPTPSPTPTVEPTQESIEDIVSSESEDNIESEENTINEENIQSEEVEPDLGYTIIAIDEVTMYATTNANLRSGPSTDYDIVDSMAYGESAVFNGYVEEGDSVWYVIKTDNEEDVRMISKSLISSTKPQPQQSSGNGGGSSAQQPSGGGDQPSGGGQQSGGGEPQGNTSADNPYADSSAPGGFFIPGAGENAGAGNDSAIGDGSGAGIGNLQ